MGQGKPRQELDLRHGAVWQVLKDESLCPPIQYEDHDGGHPWQKAFECHSLGLQFFTVSPVSQTTRRGKVRQGRGVEALILSGAFAVPDAATGRGICPGPGRGRRR